MKITAEKMPVWAKVFKGKKGKYTRYSTIITDGQDADRKSMFVKLGGKSKIFDKFPKTDGKFFIEIKDGYLACDSYEKGKETVTIPVIVLLNATVLDDDDE